jgi:hypothetical protein
MVALVALTLLALDLLAVVAEEPPPLVHQVRLSLEAMVVLAPSSPSQARPPRMLEEAGVQAPGLLVPLQASGEQGVGAKAGSLGFQLVPLVLPTLVVGAGVGTLEDQVAPAS